MERWAWDDHTDALNAYDVMNRTRRRNIHITPKRAIGERPMLQFRRLNFAVPSEIIPLETERMESEEVSGSIGCFTKIEKCLDCSLSIELLKTKLLSSSFSTKFTVVYKTTICSSLNSIFNNLDITYIQYILSFRYTMMHINFIYMDFYNRKYNCEFIG